MCLIIECKKDIPLPDGFLHNAFKRNDDGFGFMYIKDNRMEVEKYVDQKVELLIERYQALKEYDPVIHLRMKTHGLIDHTNTHPYYCRNGIWLMHNGVLNINTASDPDKSDTWHFIHRYLNTFLSWAKNPHQLIRSAKFKDIIEKMIGSNNRIVLGDRGGYVFFNEDTWHTCTKESSGVKGLRVSNTYAWDEGYNDPKPVYSVNTYRVKRYASTGMIQIDENLWADYNGEIWEKNPNESFWFKLAPEDLSKNRKKKLKKKLARKQAKAADTEKKQMVIIYPTKSDEGQKPESLGAPASAIENTTLPVCVPGTEPIVPFDVAANEEEDSVAELEVITKPVCPTDDEYIDNLIREYSQFSLPVLNSMVYTDPDDAAKVIHKLLHRV